LTLISNIVDQLPKGAVVGTDWLLQKGVSNDLAKHYVRSGWLQRVGVGAYCLRGGDPVWQGAMWGFQQVDAPVWPGGATALALQGYAQNVSFGEGGQVSLFADSGFQLPAWFKRQDWGQKVSLHRIKLFAASADDAAWQMLGWQDQDLRVSSPEQAVLEIASLVRDEHSFEQLRHAMEALPSLRPKRMNTLLSVCRSVKASRLVVLLGEHYRHPWIERLHRDQLNLGRGNRQLWRGGALHPDYKITVSRSLLDGV
jgi:hypothetical protein